ncbi:MAG: hypothetical protein HY890_05220 [Deltaproteobacteria bacterium]|nr:hypothetical protein [Deltaproteobacteria bacterium]
MPYKKSTSANRGMTVVYSGNSSVTVKKDGTLAWRNNNPGNLVCGSFSESHGAIGCNKSKAVFPDIETGRKAQTSLLKTRRYQSSTIAGAIEQYAPPNQNPTEKYIQYVTKKTGMSRDRKLGGMTPQEFDRFTGAIRRYENLTPGTEITLPRGGSSQGASSDRTLKRVGDMVYRIEKGRVVGSFICNGRKK